MNQRARKINVWKICLVGLLAAMVFVLSLPEIRIPLAFGDKTRLHLGNVMCLLSGLLFGPGIGGLAAGFGSMLYDLSKPEYATEFWITFLTKFAMGFMAGLVAKLLDKKAKEPVRYILAGLSGQVLYIVLYLCKTAIMQRFIYYTPWPGVVPILFQKLAVSSVNGLIAVAGSVILALALEPALRAAGVYRRLEQTQSTGHSRA